MRAWQDDLAPDDAVLFVGTGLTMVDVAVALHERGHRGRIYAISRHGLRPQIYGPDAPDAPAPCPLRPDRGLSAPMAVRRVHAETRRAGEADRDWRAVVDALRPAAAALWQGLSPEEKGRLLRHARPYWDTHRRRIAPPVAATIARMEAPGQLAIRAGHILGYRERPDGVDVTVRPRAAEGCVTLRVGAVVNCTGASFECRRGGPPLIARLRERELVQPAPLGLGPMVDADGGLRTRWGRAAPSLYAIGPLRQGALWETTAIPEIRAQASALTALLVDNAAPRGDGSTHTREDA